MIAYSDQKDYVEGDFVHVLVPLGDYTQKKIILGKVKATEEVVTDIRPFERFAPVTENLNTRYDTAADEFTFVVNKDYEKIIFNKVFSEPKQYLGYNRLGIKLSISAIKPVTFDCIFSIFSDIAVFIASISFKASCNSSPIPIIYICIN